MTRLLRKDEPLPYDILLLADEPVEVVDRYIFDCEIYVYERDGKIIGEYSLYPISNEVIEIKNIAVLTEEQGKGVGQLLLKDAETRAREKGCKTQIIGTGDVMMMQLYVYQKAGFEMYDLKKNFYIDNYPRPLFENGLQLKHMVMLKKELNKNY
ncbi:N-acetyltransferase [Cytophagales bacterium WSM2-2]|nr:N-acetyltransferase [Cytophagales bacterium WSM2-2]